MKKFNIWRIFLILFVILLPFTILYIVVNLVFTNFFACSWNGALDNQCMNVRYLTEGVGLFINILLIWIFYRLMKKVDSKN
jgi:uncharacterized BrkB/YihY/UPF0761 family membrane protein